MTKIFILSYILTYGGVLGLTNPPVNDRFKFESQNDCQMVLSELNQLNTSFEGYFSIEVTRACEEV